MKVWGAVADPACPGSHKSSGVIPERWGSLRRRLADRDAASTQRRDDLVRATAERREVEPIPLHTIGAKPQSLSEPE